MIITVITENSTYVLDEARKTWSRTERSPGSGALRTSGGLYDSYELAIDRPLRIFCPPIAIGTDGRLILTSPVVTYLREQ